MLRLVISRDAESLCCDAVSALASVLPEGPGRCEPVEDRWTPIYDRPDCWAVVEAWKQYFDPEYLPMGFPMQDRLRLIFSPMLPYFMLALPVLCGGTVVILAFRFWRKKRRAAAA
jgi:hypothetical protein